jgi:para-aminobenzoate synthetase
LGDASDGSAAVVRYDVNSSVLGIARAAGHAELPVGIFDYLARFEGISLRNPPPCPFVGGHVGWFGYELGRECGGTTPGVSATPDALFIQANRFIAVDHLTARVYVVAVGPENEPALGRWVDDTMRRLGRISSPPPVRRKNCQERLVFRLQRNRTTYLSDISQCLEWIRQGETYQVCLTNEITTQAKVDPLELYRVLRRTNPAPYAAFIRWPGGAVLSASPERFLSVSKAKHVEAKPIKGTIARDGDPAIDSRRASELSRSSKDRAENVMIVDLLRNDLSRVCKPGSVVVPKLCQIESYATVHQMVSTVHGVLRDGHSAIDLIRAAFPGGSMTGAPKIRTLELIHQLEGRARGIYSGALGWLGYDGAIDLSIVIRTIVEAGGCLSMGAGGGIVAQSTPEGEFEEMLLKARASIRAIVLAANGNFDDASYRIEGI